MKLLAFWLLFSISGQAWAQTPSESLLKLGLVETNLTEALDNVVAGSVIVLGEEHGTPEGQAKQLQIIENIRQKGLFVSVGMEFFNYPFQAEVDQWRQGQLAEDQFLKAIGWGGGFPFDFYRPQVQFPRLGLEFVVALNAPKSVTSKIAKSGLNALSPDEAALLPPQFALGNALYKERFIEEMGGHLPNPQAEQNYFTAQSVWDDTMSWKASEFLKEHPEQVLVIIVGEFHVRYGGGLPDRLKARGVSKVKTFSLLNLQGLSPAEELELVQPSLKYGTRSDYVWVTRF